MLNPYYLEVLWFTQSLLKRLYVYLSFTEIPAFKPELDVEFSSLQWESDMVHNTKADLSSPSIFKLRPELRIPCTNGTTIKARDLSETPNKIHIHYAIMRIPASLAL
jgi:hypothetical protein